MSMGWLTATDESACTRSERRGWGYSPMNFVVMWSFSGGVQASLARGRKWSIKAMRAGLACCGNSIAVNRRMEILF